MEEDKGEIKSLIVDTNVIFSSLISSEGPTRIALVLILNNSKVRSLAPDTIIHEINKHINLLERKAELPPNLLRLSIQGLISKIELVKEEDFKSEILESINLVNDEKDSPFAGLALKARPSILVTFNKKDYKVNELLEMDVKVLTPTEALKELGINMLSYTSKRKRKFDFMKLLYKIFFEIMPKHK